MRSFKFHKAGSPGSIPRLFAGLIFGLSLAVTGVAAEGSDPFPFSLGSVSGYTDFHAHQMGHLGFGGRHYWGHHEGPENIALKGCNGANHALSWLPVATAIIGQPDLGMHLSGTHGHNADSSKSYKDWPVWQSTVHQQYWEGHLKQAHQDGLRLFMMSAVNFNFLCAIEPVGNTNSYVLADLLNNPQDQSKQCDDMVNVKRQLIAARNFANKNPDWYQIAETPAQARSIIQQGKMAVVLQVEASKIWGEKNDTNWNNIKARLDTLASLGVRAYQITHEIDNNVGGPAYFHKMFDLFTSIDNYILQAPSTISENYSFLKNEVGIDTDSREHNRRGLTTVGKTLVRELMARNFIVDITHLSERGVNDVYEIAKENKYYPLFVSHGHFRDMFAEHKQDEKMFPSYTIEKIKETGGIFGLRPPPDRVKTFGFGSQAPVKNNCHGSSRSFAQSYLQGTIGFGLKIGFGVDMTGMIASARPRFYDPNSKWGGNIGLNAPSTWACGDSDTKDERNAGRTAQGTRSANGLNNDFDLIGVAHVGHLKNLIRDLNKLQVDTTVLEDSAEAFVVMWERIHDANRVALPKSVSIAGIDHSSYTKACPYIAPTLTRREKVGVLRDGDTDSGTPHYVSICKAYPHTEIQNHNCSDYGRKNGTYCIKERDGGKWYSARRLKEDNCPVPLFKIDGQYKNGKILCIVNSLNVNYRVQKHNCSGYQWNNYCVTGENSYYFNVQHLIDDKCPVPHSKINGINKSGKLVCQDTLDRNIQDRNCSGSGKYKWGSRCVVSETSWHVRVRDIIEDKCPVPHVKLNGTYRNGKIVCRDGFDSWIQRKNCTGSDYIWYRSGTDYCIMNSSSYHYRIKYVKNDNCPTGYWLQLRHSNQKPICKPTVTSKISSSKCTSDGGSRYSGYCIWNKGYWYKGRVLK